MYVSNKEMAERLMNQPRTVDVEWFALRKVIQEIRPTTARA